MRQIGWTLAISLFLATGCDEGGASDPSGPGDDAASEDRAAPPADAWIPGCTGEFVLTSWRDHDDADPDDGVCETGRGDDGQPECTLRAAITQANACPGPDEILQNGEGYATALEPASALPLITEALTIDGTAQPILVLGESAGPGTHGLHVTADGTILRGIRFERFGGDGVYAELAKDETIHLVNVGLTDNCGWGLRSGGRVELGYTTATTYEGQRSVIRGNGVGDACDGGGVFAWRSDARVANVLITENDGTGILTWGDLDLQAVEISENRGDGVYAEAGHVTLELDLYDTTIPVSIRENLGRGIYGGGSYEDPDEDDHPKGVSLLHPVDIRDNAGWGVVGMGRVAVGFKTTYTVHATPSVIQGNGDGPICWEPGFIEDGEANLVARECLGGGVLGASMSPQRIGGTEIRENSGPGILAWSDIAVMKTTVVSNGAGGIHSEVGRITVLPMDGGGDTLHVAGNAGHGLQAGQSSDADEGWAEDFGVEALAPLFASHNGGWGVLSEGPVRLRSISDSPLSQRSEINGNGDGEACFEWVLTDADDDQPTPASIPCEGGGIYSWADGVTAFNLDIQSNGGPGILADHDVTIAWMDIRENKGDGIRALVGEVLIPDLGIELAPNDIYWNQGFGIYAGGGTCQDETDPCGVFAEDAVTVQANDGPGIASDKNGISIGWDAYSGDPYDAYSVVHGNAKGTECWSWDDEGEESFLYKYDCPTGGLIALNGAGVDLLNTNVTSNDGHGIDAEDEVYLEVSNVKGSASIGVRTLNHLECVTCEICDNAAGNLDAPGDVNLSVGGKICHDDGDACIDDQPCNTGSSCCEEVCVVGFCP